MIIQFLWLLFLGTIILGVIFASINKREESVFNDVPEVEEPIKSQSYQEMHLSLRNAYTFAFYALVSGAKYFIGGILLTALCIMVIFDLYYECLSLSLQMAFLLPFIVLVIGLICLLRLGMIRVALNIYEGKKLPTLSDILIYKNRILPYIGWSIIFRALTNLGVLLFVIPGYYWDSKYSFFDVFLVDSPTHSAWKKSARLSSGSIIYITGFNLFSTVIFYLIAATFIGILFTWPLSVCTHVFLYKKLREQKESKAIPAVSLDYLDSASDASHTDHSQEHQQ
jgi:hypothetical protein